MVKKLIVENNLERISIDDLIELLYAGPKAIVYYRSGDKNTAVPCFLKKEGNNWGFISPIPDYKMVYKENNLRDCLRSAMSQRKIFVVSMSEYEELFSQF